MICNSVKTSVCIICKKEFSYPSDRKGIYCSLVCCYKNRSLIAKEGWKNRKNKTAWNKGKQCPKDENANHWRGDNVEYGGLHQWLQRKFGNPKICQSESCKGESRKYEWALIKNCKYERKRKNFIRLCKSCHNFYDEVYIKGWITKKI